MAPVRVWSSWLVKSHITTQVCNVSHEKVSDMEDSLQITTTANEIKYKLGR